MTTTLHPIVFRYSARVLGAALAVGAVLALTACGGDDAGATDAAATDGAAVTTDAPAESAAETTEAAAGPVLPAQTVGQIADCSLWDFADMQEIWGVTFTDTDDNQVTELNGPGSLLYSCDYNETDSGLGLTVDIEFKQYLSEDEAIVSMNNTRDGAKFGDTVYFLNEEVDGVGDEAFFSIAAADEGNPTPIEVQIYARYGSLVILGTAVNLDGVDGAAARDGLVATLHGGIG